MTEAPMDPTAIFGVQFLMSLAVFSLLAKWYVVPWLGRQSFEVGLAALLVPHAFRHVGLSFLVTGVVARPLPEGFSNPAAFGDLAAALLAIGCLLALQYARRIAIPLTYLFTAVGAVDLAYALVRGFLLDAQLGMGATWFIPTFIVPALLVSHALIFRLLNEASEQLRQDAGEVVVG